MTTRRIVPVLVLIPLTAMLTLGCGNDRRTIRKQTDTYRTVQPSPASGSSTTTTVFKKSDNDEED